MQLQNDLLRVTLENSGFETKRSYISLSHIMNDVDTLIRQYEQGYSDSEETRIRCRMGYWMEKGMMERLSKIEGIEPGGEIVVPESNGLIMGHPDFKYEGCPGDCKSFPLDEHLPETKNIPKRIYWQMNAYMLYSNSPVSYLVCESRQSGKMIVLRVIANAYVQELIKNKVAEILKRIKL